MSVTQGTVSQWESGTTCPRADIVPKVAQVLGCEINELFAVSNVDTDAS